MKTVVEMTREAGGFDATPKFLERFAELVRADEREACAKVCDAMYAEYPEENQDYAFALAAQQLAAAIQARGNT
jgi:hypothetical protein